MTSFMVVMCDDLPTVDGRLEDHMAFISALRDEGINFTRYETASPRCGPNRWAWFMAMLSRYTGMVDNDHAGAGFSYDDTSTIAVALDAVGVRCGLFGKYTNGFSGFQTAVDPFHELVPPGWWIGHDPESPERSGWQSFRSNGDFFGYDLLVGTPGVEPRGIEIDERGNDDEGRMNPLTDYSTDLTAYRATRFILDPDNDGVPLLVYWAPKAPHSPGDPAARHVNGAACAGIGLFDPPSWNEEEVDWSDPPTNLIKDKPVWIQNLPLLTPGTQESLKSRCETMQAVDEGAEDIYNAFVTSERDDDLLVLYLADNGFLMGQHRVEKGKSACYRPSRRITMIAHHKDHMGSVPGRDCDHPVSTIDVPATILEMAGATMGHEITNAEPALGAIPFTAALSDAFAPAAREEHPVEQDIRVEEVSPWMGFSDAEGNFYSKMLFGSPAPVPMASEGELYLADDVDEMVNRFYDPAYAALAATMETRWQVLAGTLPYRPFVEWDVYPGQPAPEYSHVGIYDSTNSEDNITIPLLRACPAGWHIVIAASSSNSASAVILAEDDTASNVWQIDHEQNEGAFGLWLASVRVDVDMDPGDEVRLRFFEPGLITPREVHDRHARAFLVRNLHQVDWFDRAVFTSAASTAFPINEIATSAADQFLINATSYATAGGVLKEAPGFVKEDSWTGASRKFAVQRQTVFAPATYRFGAELTAPAGWRDIMGAYFKNPAPDEGEPPEVPSGVQRVLMFVR